MKRVAQMAYDAGPKVTRREDFRVVAIHRGAPLKPPTKCSCCYGDTEDGVYAHSDTGTFDAMHDAHVFLCLGCARRIGEAAR